MSRDQILKASEVGSSIVYGATTSYAAWIAASAADAARPVVVVTASEDQARSLAADVRFFATRAESDDLDAAPSVLYVPANGTSPYAEISSDRSALAARQAALYHLSRPERPKVVVLSALSLMRRVLGKEHLANLSRVIESGQELDRDQTALQLTQAGYVRTSIVEDAGSFSVRGGVIDVFPSLYTHPIRVELFGDEVESLRTFDPATQRTLRQLDRFIFHPVRETIRTDGADPRKRILEAADRAAHPSKETRRLLESLKTGEEFVGLEVLTPAFHQTLASLEEYLGEYQVRLLLAPDEIRAAIGDELELAHDRYRDRLDDHRLAFAPGDHYIEAEELEALLCSPRRVEFRDLELAEDSNNNSVRVELDLNQRLRTELERARRQQAFELTRPLVNSMEGWESKGLQVVLAVPSRNREQQLRGLLMEMDVDLPVIPELGAGQGGHTALLRRRLSAGFVSPADGIAVVTGDDVFGPRRQISARQRKAAKRAQEALLGGVADFSNLAVGNFLVHNVHGVGRYRGLMKLPVGSGETDFLNVEYRGGTLYLPVYRMGEVQRYVGADGKEPKLDKLGGSSWDTSQRKVKKAVRALAELLLQLYAQRAALPGHPFPAADALFHDFEASFEFEETPDQQRAIDAVCADMEREQPMDRLVCGDVGYGKTEVALRAVLKAVLGGKQAAILAPTTVLVEQHYRTMSKRFESWPIRIGRLSRFQGRKEQLETIKALADGSLDAVVGTHRLLSKDLRFKDLGLLVIDEEQRFGVTHKERLKRIRTQVDVLTLTATPIPRTLHLAMTGLRDLSIIATPPADRRSIRTFVARPDDDVIRHAARRELARGGQIFFVAPRIEASSGQDMSLTEWREHLVDLLPEARIGMAHGQLSETALEQAMVAFVGGETDILACTTIVESGLDIPRANTMFIANADRFGLSQLYQLRGRIGRSKERAFCYLLVPRAGRLTDDAKKRLEALQRFSDLGAGFAIASRDLEIRGAGELLGAKQSGSIAAVGFETYARLLEEAVAELRGEEIHRLTDPELNVSDPGFIPDDYVPDTGQRLSLYKRLSNADEADDVAELIAEIADCYGPVPAEVERLAELMVLKSQARKLAVQSLELSPSRMVLAFAAATPLNPEAIRELVVDQPERYRLTPDMRLSCSLGSNDSNKMASARSILLDLLGCVTR